MLKRFVAILLSACLLFMPATAMAKSYSGTTANHVYEGAKSYSGSRSFGSHSFGSSGSTYHSGYRSPSSSVGRSYGGSYYGSSRGFGGFGSHMFSFGSGFLFGSMFHPFGGSYYGFGGGYGYHSFSLLGLIFDIFLIWVIYRLIRAFFRRR